MLTKARCKFALVLVALAGSQAARCSQGTWAGFPASNEQPRTEGETMTRTRRETLTATALVAAIVGASFAQALDRPSPQPSPPVRAYLMPVHAPQAHHPG